MAVNKVIINGETAVDLTADTITPGDLRAGITAHNAAGDAIIGTLPIDEAPLPKPYALTDFWDYTNNVEEGLWRGDYGREFSGDMSTADDYVQIPEQALCSFGEQYAFTVYAVLRAEDDTPGTRELLATSHDMEPRFNLCSYNGNYDIVTSDSSGGMLYLQEPSNEWRVVALTFEGGCNFGKGTLYMDGVGKNYPYNFFSPYSSPAVGDIFISGRLKALAVCCGCAHGENVIAENSEYLRNKYLNK